MSYINGNTIKELREKKKMTQRELADKLCISDKTVSKWETGHGLPDIMILPELSASLDISVAELMTGDIASNDNRHANMKKMKFYVCPVCGNVIQSIGEGSFCCCGVQLPPLEAAEEEAEEIQVTCIENEYYVQVSHEMTKTHSISFLAYVTTDSVQFYKLYPEQNAEASFMRRGRGIIYAYCNRHGLLSHKL